MSAHRPRPWLAALLDLEPGLGHAYAGLWRRGALLLAIDLALGTAMAVAMVRLPGAPANIVLPVVLLAAWRVAIVVRGWRDARGAAGWPTTGRTVAVTLGFLVAQLVAQQALARALNAALGQAFRIPSVAMAPTVRIGDYLMAEPLRRPPRRDEVVTFRRDGRLLLQRVAGLPGDTLAMRDGALLRNGRPVDEPWRQVQSVAGVPAEVLTWGPAVVPPDSVFLLGDNRTESLDSRYRGFVPMDALVGRPTRIYWTSPVDWRRIGRDVQ